MATSVLRHELRPFDVRVVTLMTGHVRTAWFSNVPEFKLPPSSLYLDIKDVIEIRAKGVMSGRQMEKIEFAEKVIHDLVHGSQHIIWRGILSSTSFSFSDYIADAYIGCSYCPRNRTR
jgi:1-acylglycerone phosphate reductase